MNEYALLPYPFFFLILTYGYITMKMKNFFFKVIIPLMVFCLWFYFLPVANIINKYVTPIQDNYETLNTLFTGLAFWGAYMAYRTQNEALTESEKQTAIAREQNMDAACFEYLNYLESRKLAIDESGNNRQPFNWLRYLYRKEYDEDSLRDDLTKNKLLFERAGTWYRTVMLWLDRVVTAYPNDPELCTRYTDMLLDSLSVDEQRCIECYAYCTGDATSVHPVDEDRLTIIKNNTDQFALRAFLEKHPRKVQIQTLLSDFFENRSLQRIDPENAGLSEKE